MGHARLASIEETPMDPSSSTFADEREIIALAHRYASSIDDRNLGRYLSCYTEDAIQRSPIYEACGHQAIGALVQVAWQKLGALHHMMSNFEIVVNGDTATMRSCVIGTHVARERIDRVYTIGAVYSDRLVRRADGWKIAERQTRIEWATGDPTVLGLDEDDKGTVK
jgi:3-phenylpropionate/cinnamic acid dioxygenase small subunit